MRLLGPIAVATAGVDGSATGEATTSIILTGELRAVHVANSAGQGATTTVTITTVGTNAPAKTLFAKGSKPAGWFNPVAAQHLNTDGSALLFYDYQVVNDYVKVALTLADNAETTTVYLELED